MAWAITPAFAQKPAEAASPPLTISLLVSSRAGQCYEPGDARAIALLAKREQDRINRSGGIEGRRVQVNVFDDGRDAAKAVAGVRAAFSDPTTIAIVGLSNSNRAKAVFDEMGKVIKASSIPFLSSISVNSIFEAYPNVFTTQASQDDARLPVMSQFIQQIGFENVVFVGQSDAVFSTALGDGLKRQLGSKLAGDFRMRSAGEGLNKVDLAATIASLKEKQPDLVVLGLGGQRAAAFMTELQSAGVTPSLFVSGRLESISPEATKTYPSALYQLGWDRLPEADNDRLRRLISRDDPKSWFFEGAKLPDGPGWKAGTCAQRSETTTPDPLQGSNLRTIEIAAQFADMIALVAAIGREAAAGNDIAELRRQIIQNLTTTYAAGRGVFRGSFDNWSFNPQGRSAVRTPFVVIQPPGLGRSQLAPVQFARIKGGGLRQVDTFYLDIDLIRAHRIDDNEKTFFAEFYLSMRDGKSASIDQIEFSNAYLDPKTNGRQITIEVLHPGGQSAAYPESMKVYKVAGRFTFDPELTSYPFDTQRFAIDLLPKRGDRPFVVQAPPLQLRDKQVTTDGWDVKSQYVGYDEDFVPLLDAYTHEPSVVPFYRSSFVWMMKRQTTDYFLRVVVPLIFILIVAYLSIFISLSHFEAIVTIQVTALLSAVALYLSIPKLDADAATISDRIFVFDYMMVSLMIVISILRANRLVVARPALQRMLSFAHIVLVPAMIAGMAYFLYGVSNPV